MVVRPRCGSPSRRPALGKYLDLIARAKASENYDINDINDKIPNGGCVPAHKHNQQSRFGRIGRFGRTLSELERRCPAHVEPARWRQALRDGEGFLAEWGEQAEALGWTAPDLFGLHEIPARAHPAYQRLSRYDCTGLIWLLQGCPVVALTEATAAIKMPTGNVTTYRRHNRPAYGPMGDSIDDFVG